MSTDTPYVTSDAQSIITKSPAIIVNDRPQLDYVQEASSQSIGNMEIHPQVTKFFSDANNFLTFMQQNQIFGEINPNGLLNIAPDNWKQYYQNNPDGLAGLANDIQAVASLASQSWKSINDGTFSSMVPSNELNIDGDQTGDGLNIHPDHRRNYSKGLHGDPPPEQQPVETDGPTNNSGGTDTSPATVDSKPEEGNDVFKDIVDTGIYLDGAWSAIGTLANVSFAVESGGAVAGLSTVLGETTAGAVADAALAVLPEAAAYGVVAGAGVVGVAAVGVAALGGLALAGYSLYKAFGGTEHVDILDDVEDWIGSWF